MFSLFFSVLLCMRAISANAQNSTAQWCDSQTSICFQRFHLDDLDIGFGYLFPPADQATDEFIGIFTAPTEVGWIGNSLTGRMRDSLLIVAWMNDGQALITPRLTSSLTSPDVYDGPKLTVLGSSGLNSTHQRVLYRCQNCTTWSGGSIPSTDTAFGFATHGSLKPVDADDPNSILPQHSSVGHHSIDIEAARSDTYQSSLELLQDLPITGSSQSPATPTSTPTSTGSLKCSGAPQPSYALVTASGYTATPVLGNLTTPRGIALDASGNLLVVQRGHGITVHTTDTQTGCVSSSKLLINDTSLNHGIDIVAEKLYASSITAAYVWDYDSETQEVSNRTTIVTGMHDGGHSTRTLWVSRTNPRLLVISQGSDGNIDTSSFSPTVARAIVKVFDLESSMPMNYTSAGTVLGYGLRNDVAVTEDRAGNIVTAENSMDNAFRHVNDEKTDVHTDNPAEIVWNLGNPANTSDVFYGYPHCFFVWDPESFVDKTFEVGDWFVQQPNDTINDAWCSEMVPKSPLSLLPPHSAPLDAKFGLGNDTSLYVSFHGSWNRDPPVGYKVVSIPGSYSASGEWKANSTLSSPQFDDVLMNTDESRCTRGCFRPVGLAWSENGNNLYVSSDASGEVFLVQKRNETKDPEPTTTTVVITVTTTTTTTTTAAPQTITESG